jgi:hypothetical protein
MKIEVWYEAPDADVIELNEEEEELWIKYSDLREKAMEAVRNREYDKYREIDGEADDLFEELSDLLYPKLTHNLPVEDITEW